MARRKRQAAAGGSAEDDVNLTPMLDVVFILLIFFIVTAQFIKEPGVPVIRPDVDNKVGVKPLAILIAINANSEIYVDKQIVSPNEIGFVIKEMRNDNPGGKVVIQADVDAEAQVMVDVMEAINKVDGTTVINISAKTTS
ncbi:MAG: biopolymer transporter ExbD [Alphaproteobacteria bacterium HGW-Alphaproteobacteria-18]|nr:MAG: biopolymer transporter ExbD [Alphaproteobacteria bacterium HGW-Alphaproteobacteria-18]